MKKFILTIGGTLLTALLFAQAPQKMTYQAVVRNASNAIVTNTGVGLKISIVQDNPNGIVVYSETHQPTTNANGLFSIQIGAGTVQNGTFSSINWANDEYFVKTEIDPAGGTNYTITNTTQFLSVPYAFHAKTAESVSGPITVTETDPVFSASPAAGITATNITTWNNKQDQLTAGTNISITGNVISATGGSAGNQDVYEAKSTGQLSISTIGAYTLIPGTTITVTLQAGTKIFLQADGGMQSLGAGTTYSIVYTSIDINGTTILNERLNTLANTGSGGVGQIIGSFNNSAYYVVPTTGSYTFNVKAKLDSQSTAGVNVGGALDGVMKASLKLIIIK